MAKVIVRAIYFAAFLLLIHPSCAQAPEQKAQGAEAATLCKDEATGNVEAAGNANPQPVETAKAAGKPDAVPEEDGPAKREKAIKAAEDALHQAEQDFGRRDLRLVKPLTELAEAYEANDQNQAAKGAYLRARAILKRNARGHRDEIAELDDALSSLQASGGRAGSTFHHHSKGFGGFGGVGGFRGFRRHGGRAFGASGGRGAHHHGHYSRGGRGLHHRSLGGREDEKVAAADEAKLPEFPWPPPASSASYVFPGEVFKKYATVGKVSSCILKAMDRLGYVEHSFFSTPPGGVALATRLERMADDGSPAPAAERWPAGFEAGQTNLIEFLKGLFFVQPGRYRVIVFILQDSPFQQSRTEVSGQEAKAWLREGMNFLPRDIAERSFGAGTCTALIYEFASDGGKSAKIVESTLAGKQHLEKAGLLAALY